MVDARTAALRLRSGYWFRGRGTPALRELLGVAADLGVAVDVDWPLPGRVRSIYGYGSIALQAGLSRSWQRWCLAHELGHHLLHRPGNHLYLARDRDGVAREESEAERFAGHLLFGDLDRWPADPSDVMELALAADLPYTATDRWVRGASPQSTPGGRTRAGARPLVRPWSPFLTAALLLAPLLRLDLDLDGAVQIMRAAEHVGRVIG